MLSLCIVRAAVVVVVVISFRCFVLLISFRFFDCCLACSTDTQVYAASLHPRTVMRTPFPFPHFTLKVFFKRKSEQKRRNDLFLFERVDFVRSVVFRVNLSVCVRAR